MWRRYSKSESGRSRSCLRRRCVGDRYQSRGKASRLPAPLQSRLRQKSNNKKGGKSKKRIFTQKGSDRLACSRSIRNQRSAKSNLSSIFDTRPSRIDLRDRVYQASKSNGLFVMVFCFPSLQGLRKDILKDPPLATVMCSPKGLPNRLQRGIWSDENQIVRCMVVAMEIFQ